MGGIEDAELNDILSTRELAPPRRARRRRTLLLILFGAGAYAVALLVSLPAAIAMRAAGVETSAPSLSGTVWRGQAELGGGIVADWRWMPWRSLRSVGLAAELTVRGAGNNLVGRIVLRPGSALVAPLTGQASWTLVETLAPRLPFRCDLGLQVAVERLSVGRDANAIDGEIRSGPGACRAKVGSGQPAPMPAMTATSTIDRNGSTLRMVGSPDRKISLMDGAVTPQGRLTLRVRPAGAAIAPPGTLVGGTSVEMDL